MSKHGSAAPSVLTSGSGVNVAVSISPSAMAMHAATDLPIFRACLTDRSLSRKIQEKLTSLLPSTTSEAKRADVLAFFKVRCMVRLRSSCLCAF